MPPLPPRYGYNEPDVAARYLGVVLAARDDVLDMQTSTVVSTRVPDLGAAVSHLHDAMNVRKDRSARTSQDDERCAGHNSCVFKHPEQTNSWAGHAPVLAKPMSCAKD